MYFCLGSLSDRAALLGFPVHGNIEGATMGNKTYKLGAITSVFLSKYMMDQLDLDAVSPFPVGFDEADAETHVGAIARQFPSVTKLESENGDRDVIKAYLEPKGKADPRVAAPIHDVPSVGYDEVMDISQVGSKRVDGLDEDLLQQDFYIRVRGSHYDVEALKAICKEEGLSWAVESGDIYITNVDLNGFPPQPQHIFGARLSDVLPGVPDEVAFAAPRWEGRDVPPPQILPWEAVSMLASQGLKLQLPKSWYDFVDFPCGRAYVAMRDCVQFQQAVHTYTRKLGDKSARNPEMVWANDIRISRSSGETEFCDLIADVRGYAVSIPAEEREQSVARTIASLKDSIIVLENGNFRM